MVGSDMVVVDRVREVGVDEDEVGDEVEEHVRSNPQIGRSDDEERAVRLCSRSRRLRGHDGVVVVAPNLKIFDDFLENYFQKSRSSSKHVKRQRKFSCSSDWVILWSV